jgi:aldose 1-epimerase
VLAHSLESPAAFLLATDEDLLADGQILSVAGTGCDFRAGKRIGLDFDRVSLRPNRDRTAGVGFDHTLVLGPGNAGGLRRAATLFCPESGIGFELETSAPAMQVYSGGDLGYHLTGKGGAAHVQGGGIALETLGFSCSTEFAHFPSLRLAPGEEYRHDMVFAFFQDAGRDT